jgi:predicted  nucleic acid-binding Zn-ribbon protein
MITDKDIQKLKAAFSSKKDHGTLEKKVDTLSTNHVNLDKKVDTILKNVEKLSGDAAMLTKDHVSLERKFDEIAEKVNTIEDKLSQLPTRADMEVMLERSLTFATIKVEHDRMKQIIKDKLQVEI